MQVQPPVPPNARFGFTGRQALAAGLEHGEERDAARVELRGFLDKIVILEGEGLLQGVGKLKSMLTRAQGRSEAMGYLAGRLETHIICTSAGHQRDDAPARFPSVLLQPLGHPPYV